MERAISMKKMSSFRDEGLSIINIKYTVIKRLLEVYSVDEVSLIVGIDIAKVQLFKETASDIATRKEYFIQHPLNSVSPY